MSTVDLARDEAFLCSCSLQPKAASFQVPDLPHTTSSQQDGCLTESLTRDQSPLPHEETTLSFYRHVARPDHSRAGFHQAAEFCLSRAQVYGFLGIDP